MNGKIANISKWVFGILALVTAVIAILYYVVVGTIKPDFDAGLPTPRADMYLNWGYILIILGIVLAVVSAIFTGIVKGVNFTRSLLITLVALVVVAVVAFFMSKGSFGIEYPTNEQVYSGSTHGWVEWGLNFFYLTLGVSIVAILYSVIKSGK